MNISKVFNPFAKKQVAPDETKLALFGELLEKESLAQLRLDGVDCECNRENSKVHAHIGPKYTRVDIGSSGRYMVVNETGEIFGIKAYGVIHRGHRFGTLDTISDYYWGGSRGVPIIKR